MDIKRYILIMETMTNAIMRKTEGLKKNYKFELPIKKVCDIKCSVEMAVTEKKNGSNSIKLNIDSELYDENSDPIVLFSKTYLSVKVSNIKEKIQKVFDDLNNLQLNKFCGCICTKDEIFEHDITFAMSELITNENIKKDFDECCVCLEPTWSHLNCSHHICVKCLDRIEPSYEASFDEPQKKCPYCRSVVCISHSSQICRK